MDISNVQGFNAYTANKPATPPVDNALLQNQNREAAQTDLTQENIQAAQQAFEVDITREARDLMAAEGEASAQTTPQEQNPMQVQNPAQDPNLTPAQRLAQEEKTRQAVDIVA